MADTLTAPELRIATAADIPAMHEVRCAVHENALRTRTISAEDYRTQIEDSGRGWVVEVDGQIVGFAIGNAHTGNIWALFVHPEHAGQGHGRRLFNTMVDWLRACGLQRLSLGTEPGTRAADFYRVAGWTDLGLQDGEIRFELCSAG